MLPIQKMLINYNRSLRSERPKYIVIHDVGEPSSAKNNRDYFAGGNRNASADFFIDSSNIIQIIDYNNYYSWAIGDGHGKYGKTNGNSVSIEMCLESNYQPSEQTIQNTLDLTRYLMKELNISIDNVVTHNQCSDKNCPQCWSTNNWVKWYEFKSRLSSSNIVSNGDVLIENVKDPIRVQQIKSLCYYMNLDYSVGLKHQDGNIYQELLDNLESLGKNLLKKGHKSHVVLWIQQKLVMFGWLKKGTYQEMVYDEPTFQAVTNMQKAWDRETSGVITVTNRSWEIFLNNK